MVSSALSIPGEQKQLIIPKLNYQKEKGMTLIEMILVVAIISVITRLAYGIFSNLESRTSTQTSIDTLMTEIRNQRQEAMLGYSTNGVATVGAGIYFHEGKNLYTLFVCAETGDSCLYNDQNETNLDQSIQEGIVFENVELEGDVVVFERKSGEVMNYDSTKNSFTFRNVQDGKITSFQFSEIGSVYVVE